MPAVAPAVQAEHKTVGTWRFDAAIPRKVITSKVCKEGAIRAGVTAEAGQANTSAETKAARMRARLTALVTTPCASQVSLPLYFRLRQYTFFRQTFYKSAGKR